MLINKYSIDVNVKCLLFQGLIPFEPIDLEKLSEKHALYVSQQIGQVEIMLDNFYQLPTDTSDAAIMLQVSRTMTGQMKQPINRSASKIILHQSVRINNLSSTITTFWRQICIIDTIKESVINFKETKDPCMLIFNVGVDGYVPNEL